MQEADDDERDRKENDAAWKNKVDLLAENWSLKHASIEMNEAGFIRVVCSVNSENLYLSCQHHVVEARHLDQCLNQARKAAERDAVRMTRHQLQVV
jgi:hypothetical protein